MLFIDSPEGRNVNRLLHAYYSFLFHVVPGFATGVHTDPGFAAGVHIAPGRCRFSQIPTSIAATVREPVRENPASVIIVSMMVAVRESVTDRPLKGVARLA